MAGGRGAGGTRGRPGGGGGGGGGGAGSDAEESAAAGEPWAQGGVDGARERGHTHEQVCLMKMAVCDSHPSIWAVCARIWANYNIVRMRACE